MIEALPKLEVISVYGVGFDAVDLAAARERGIRVTNTPDGADQRRRRFSTATICIRRKT